MGRSPCCDKNGLKKGPWTPEEDQKLIDYIQKNGYGNWRTLPKNAGLQRCGKSCRLRWTNYLRPDIKRGRFSFEEEETIIQLHSILGNKWSAIAARLPGRTDNEIKNYWNTHIRKRLLRMGIDPVTHSPRLDLLDLSSILNNSFYNSSPANQMNFSRLMGVQLQQQSLMNPDLLRLATSLFNSQRNKAQNPSTHQTNFLSQNGNVHPPQQHIPTTTLNHDDHYQLPPLVPEIPPVTQFSGENDQTSLNFAADLLMNDFVDDFTLPLQNSGYYGEPATGNFYQQPIFDGSTTTTTTPSDNYGGGSCFPSVLSTPSSSPSPTTLNSYSGYNNINSSSTTTTTTTSTNEDEKESYCSNMLMKFEFSDDFHLLGVNEFM